MDESWWSDQDCPKEHLNAELKHGWQYELQTSTDSILQSSNSRQNAFLACPRRTMKNRENCALRKERQKTRQNPHVL